VQPEPLVAHDPRPRLRLVASRPLRVADVAMFYAERSGGIRTYLDAKLAWNAQTQTYDHHLITPGEDERHVGGRHELPSLRVHATNGYRVPRGVSHLQRTLRDVRPDVVLLHDPFWGPLGVTRTAHELGAKVVAVGHGSSELDARGIPGPARVYAPILRAWMTRAYEPVDAIMSVIDTRADCGRAASIPLRLGLHPAFTPQHDAQRGDHVLYVGRLAKQKGVFRLLEAAALARDPWPLVLVGAGPARDAILARAARLGIADRVELRAYVSDRDALARLYAGARCVVMPGEHETFGLVALEAAASGARVVCCDTAPSGAACGELAHTYAAGDAAGMARAIHAARATAPNLGAAEMLATRYAWPRLFEAEHASMRELVRS
jgi:alpha-1,6-mannosyltransferase